MNTIKVEKTAAEIAERNKSNAEAIELGFVPAWEQSEAGAKLEREIVERTKRVEKFRAETLAAFTAIVSILPPEITKSINAEEFKARIAKMDSVQSFGFCGVSLVPFYRSGSYYRSSFAYWRAEVGYYQGRKLIKIGASLADVPKVASKIALAIETEYANQVAAENSRAKAARLVNIRDDVFKANRETFTTLGLQHYDLTVSSHGEPMKIHARVSKTLTLEQWKQVAALFESFTYN